MRVAFAEIHLAWKMHPDYWRLNYTRKSQEWEKKTVESDPRNTKFWRKHWKVIQEMQSFEENMMRTRVPSDNWVKSPPADRSPSVMVSPEKSLISVIMDVAKTAFPPSSSSSTAMKVKPCRLDFSFVASSRALTAVFVGQNFSKAQEKTFWSTGDFWVQINPLDQGLIDFFQKKRKPMHYNVKDNGRLIDWSIDRLHLQHCDSKHRLIDWFTAVMG